jgi:uncharacterized protein (DUF2336 family)
VREIFIQTLMSGLFKESLLCLVTLAVVPSALTNASGKSLTPERFICYLH